MCLYDTDITNNIYWFISSLCGRWKVWSSRTKNEIFIYVHRSPVRWSFISNGSQLQWWREMEIIESESLVKVVPLSPATVFLEYDSWKTERIVRQTCPPKLLTLWLLFANIAHNFLRSIRTERYEWIRTIKVILKKNISMKWISLE